MNRLLATTLAIASLLPTACSETHAEHPITIGVVVDCHGGFAQSREPSMAGAELPLLERGASRLGGLPSDGITDTTVGGRPVRLVEACESYADRRVTIDALTTLVEDDDADIVVGAPFNGDGIAVREFARHHADRTFLLTSFEQSPMMKRPASNTFRFELDAAQWGAGSGRFGHDRFGWKNPAVIEQAMPAWTSVAGIVADVCAAGGDAPQKVWAGTDYQMTHEAGHLESAGVDGVFIPGDSLLHTGGFVHAWRRAHPNLGRHLLLGWNLTPRRSLLGVIGSSPDPYARTPAWQRYLAATDTWFPKLDDTGLRNQPYYDAVEPVLQALEQVHGDLSHNQARFMDALAHLRYASPEGLIRLDEHHRAIGPMYFGKVVKSGDGGYKIRQIATIRNVEPTMGGQFGPTTPAPSRRSTCRS